MPHKHPKNRKIRTSPVMDSFGDSAYVLKIVMYLVLGTVWVHVAIGGTIMPIPVGVILGLWFASHDHFRIDRKIEYAVLLVAAFVAYFLEPRFIISF